MIRLDKYLAESGVGTRTEVKKIIRKGRVSVEGSIIKDPGYQVQDGAEVLLDNEKIEYSEYRYYLLNKPAGCVSAVKDSIHPTVMDYLFEENIKGCFPVGRLDIDTEGLIIITNDGAFSHRLTSPNHHIPKTYFAVLDSPISSDAIQKMKNGLDIGDEKLTRPAELSILENPREVRLTITEGRYHQVKRMFECLGFVVTFLKRERVGHLELGTLKTGEYRLLSQEEVEPLGCISSLVERPHTSVVSF